MGHGTKEVEREIWDSSTVKMPFTVAHPSLADKAKWTVGEELGSDHLPIIKELSC